MNGKKKMIIILLFFGVLSILFINYYSGYSSDIECINSTGGFVPKVDTILFKYESGNRELLLYCDENGEFNSYTLKIHKFGNKCIYKYSKFNNLHPNTYSKEWKKLNGNIKYIYTKYESDINNINCDGVEPISESFEYNIKGVGKETCWIHIIDKNK